MLLDRRRRVRPFDVVEIDVSTDAAAKVYDEFAAQVE